MDVPIGCPEGQPAPNPIGFRLANDLGSSSGQFVACSVKIVHFEQGHDAGAAAPVELEIAVAGAEQLDPVIVSADSSTVPASSKATAKPRVWVKNWTAAG